MQLNFRVYGVGEPVIVLHGLFGSLENWHSFGEHLGTGYSVITVDQRNHGGSPRSMGMSYHAMAEDLREFMDAQSITRANLLGHSMGGKTAMRFALDYPQRVQRLIVVDISPRAYDFRHREILAALLAFDPGQCRSRREMEDALAEGVPDLRVRRFLLKSVNRGSDGVFRWKLGLSEIDRNYASLAEGIAAGKPFTGPSLFLQGEFSDYLQESDRPIITQLFPRAEIQTVPGSGHWLHVENPQEFRASVLKFLSTPPEG